MTARHLTRVQDFPRPLEEVFAFFAEARNLERITPPWLKFRILQEGDIRMAEGTRIDYKLQLHGVPFRWRTKITAWEPPLRFVDEQIKGPYRLWVHEHLFQRMPGGGARVTDKVQYKAIGGPLIEWLFVNAKLRRIFDYRYDQLIKILGNRNVSS